MRRRRVRRAAVVLAAVALVLLAARLALDPLVAWRTRRVLDRLEGMHGTFSDVRVQVADLSYEIRDLRIEKGSAGGAALPFFAVDRARLGLYWKELFRGNVVAAIDLEGPRLNLIEAKKAKERAGPDRGGQEIEEAPQIGRRIEELAPFLVDRAQVKDGEILFVDAREPERPHLRIHSIEGTLENFATRPALSKGEPTVLAARAILQRSGKVSLFATADPLAKKVTFAGQGRVAGLRVAELGPFLRAKADVTPDEGIFDLTVRFRAVDGAITGGVRPILKGGGTRPSHAGLRDKLKSALADLALDIFSDDVPGRDAVATTIPIVGSVKDPRAQAVPTILGIVRNAFVRGLADSLSGLPPPKAKERESTVEQARRALSRKRGQPRAQPAPGER